MQFEIIGIDYGLSEFRDSFEKACALYGLSVEGAAASGASSGREKKKPATSAAPAVPTAPAASAAPASAPEPDPALTPEQDYTAYFARCQARIDQTDYTRRRGLDPAIVARFGLGYDPAYKSGGASWRALILPAGTSAYIARNIDPEADKRNRYRKQGASQLYNRQALQTAERPIFIVEGELDALSILSAGGEAVALGSTANAQSFLRLVAAQRPAQTLLLALDNDEGGRRAAEELAAALERLRIPHYRVDPYGDSKDANEALLADPAAFAQALRAAEAIEREAEEAERAAYARTSAASHLHAFFSGIAESADTPALPTGFGKLDAALDGGLYEGLYIVGAISSLGKTTLVCQIADQLAQTGHDALIFSLEMARAEIMAKSISRLTLLDCLCRNAGTKRAKTARGITAGKRYAQYDQEETELIQRCVRLYGTYADHVYIHEGVGDIGVEQVRQAVQRHIAFTGNRPVVIVDYLQILAPYSERMSDKQNTDKAVLELKRISRDFKLPVIGVSSFNRANYREAVTMEAFKESGAIEYSSDVLIGLQLAGAGGKDFDATQEKRKVPREVELVVLKNRSGAAGEKVGFAYYPMFNYFREG